MSLTLATIAGLIKTATAAVGLIDKVADQVTRFVKRQPQPTGPTEHRLKIEQGGTDKDPNITVKSGQGVVQTITAKDLENLPPDKLKYIRTLEASMSNHCDIWSRVYPQLSLMVDPIAKARTEAQLTAIIRDMSKDLDGILDFLVSLGVQLDDHYEVVRQIVKQA